MVETVVFENTERTPTATTSLWENGRQTGCKDRKHLELFKQWQGLPSDFNLPGFTVVAAVKAVVNGVPLAMGRAMAKAVKRAMEEVL